MVLNERLTDEVGCRILIFRCNVSNEIIFCGIIHHDQCGRTVQSSASCFGLLNSGSSGPEVVAAVLATKPVSFRTLRS